MQGDTDRTPFGLGTYGSRSTPVSGAATVVAARKVRERARLVAAAMLEVAPEDLEWVGGSLPGARRARRGGVVAGDRHGRALQPRAARRRRRPSGRDGRLQPAQPDVPVRGLRLRRRGRPRHGAGRRAPVRRGGRLRRADQPDDRRGPDPRRPRRRDRDGADGADRVRPRRATTWAPRSWTTCCRRRWSARCGSWGRRSRRRRTTRSAPRAWGSRRRSARPPPSSTPCWTRSGCGTPTCRSPRRRCGGRARGVRCARTSRSETSR